MYWLGDSDDFPDPQQSDPNQPVAVGLGLTPRKIVKAYSQGIFPWSSDGELVSWWCPDPRMVLCVEDFKCSRSLRKTLRSGKFETRRDTAFRAVMTGCAETPRRDQPEGSWITPMFINAYSALHVMGVAHSFESWRGGELVGGLYGLRLGQFFFGESMFARENDASKVALVHLVAWLKEQGIRHIDCQQETHHLYSLGARPVPRTQFLAWLKEAVTCGGQATAR